MYKRIKTIKLYVKIQEMKYFGYIFIVLICGLCFFGVVQKTNAQFTVPLQTDISTEIKPENPKPNQLVTISVISYGTDLNSANIVWKLNGKVSKSGKGLKTFSFTSGSVGVETSIEVTIETKEGEIITNTYKIKPGIIDLIWQAEGFVSPFYKGKTLFSYQDKIKFIAIPHVSGADGKEISPKNLIYKWTKNDTVMGDFSGYGYDTYTLISSIIARPVTMRVDVSSSDGVALGYSTVTVVPSDPKIVFYKKDPMYGILFQKAISGSEELGSSKEISVLAQPFFFGTTDKNSSDLSYKWQLNGNTIEEGDDSTIKTFRLTDNSSGNATISLSIENSNKILQYASNQFQLMFNNSDQNYGL